MSTFDKLCWFSERFPALFGKPLTDVIRSASLFLFPHVPHEVLPKSYTSDELQFQDEFFVLPFRVTAVEDRTSCIVLWEITNQQGLGARRFFIEFASMADDQARTWNNSDEELRARDDVDPRFRALLNSSFQFSFGSIEVKTDLSGQDGETKRWRYAVGGDVFAYHMIGEDGVRPEGEALWAMDRDRIAAGSMRNAMTAIEELMVANRPDRFIVEERPARVRPADSPKIPRSHERPVYTLLHPHEIRTKLGLAAATTTGGRFVGERRRHVRRYPDDPVRWPKMHGKAIVIPATWVGPSEAVVGRRTYRIMLDL